MVRCFVTDGAGFDLHNFIFDTSHPPSIIEPVRKIAVPSCTSAYSRGVIGYILVSTSSSSISSRGYTTHWTCARGLATAKCRALVEMEEENSQRWHAENRESTRPVIIGDAQTLKGTRLNISP